MSRRAQTINNTKPRHKDTTFQSSICSQHWEKLFETKLFTDEMFFVIQNAIALRYRETDFRFEGP
jgi:hypothetical protein